MLTLGVPGMVSLPELVWRPSALAAMWAQDGLDNGLPLGIPSYPTVTNTRVPNYTVLPILDRRVAMLSQDWVSENILTTRARPGNTPPGGHGNGPGGGSGGQGQGNHGQSAKQKDTASRMAMYSQAWVQSPLALYLLPAVPPPKPFHQDDWPVPAAPRRVVADWQTQQPPFWPTSNPVPSGQYDWPLPVTIRLPTQFWSQSPAVQPVSKPVGTMYDWPVPKGRQPPVYDWITKSRADSTPYVVNLIPFYALVFMQEDPVVVEGAMDQNAVVNLTQLYQPTYELVFAQADAVVVEAEMDANPVVVAAPFV